MTQTLQLDGATRILAIVGDPIAQVKSPAGVSAALQQQGRNAILVPSHVSPANLDAYVKGISLAGNLDGIIVTVPHKFAMYAQCSSSSDRARRLGAVNVMRRNADGSWHGDMCDGAGYVAAMRAAGCQPEGKRALLVGAGGAGSAIALALLENGVSELAIHDADSSRRDQLINRLNASFPGQLAIGSHDPSGFAIAINASPTGMQASDPLPIDAGKLDGSMFVGDVITAPAVTPLIESARALGCQTVVGGDMFAAVRELMLDFLLAQGPLAR